ncbi:MAG TPA: hypothetical protein VNN79_26035 [Actinomycetota bacterium]|nr:hypothetical protein [Actinomycetota bacterium]
MAIVRRRLFAVRIALVVALGASVSGLLAAPASATNADLDPTFGNGGQVTTGFAGSAGAVDLARQGNRILVLGSVRPSAGGEDIAIARYQSNGHPDTAFGDGGKVVVGFPGGEIDARSLLALPSGKFYVGGTFTANGFGHSTFALARFLRGGGLDTSFGDGGRVVADLGQGDFFLADLVRQANGKLVAGGNGSPAPGSLATSFGLARFGANGSVDRSYGNDGHVVTQFHVGSGDQPFAYLHGLAVDTSNRVVAVGAASSDICTFRWALARYLPNGSLDPSFGGDGRVVTKFQNHSEAWAVEFGDDNRLTVAGSNQFEGCGGSAPPATGNAALARYLPTGALDHTFGGDGKVTTTFLGSKDADASYSAMTLEEGGQIAATGSAYDQSGHLNVIVGLYLRNGNPNTAFSGDGKASAGGPGQDALGLALYEDIDGRPVVAGRSLPETGADRFLVERFKASS